MTIHEASHLLWQEIYLRPWFQALGKAEPPGQEPYLVLYTKVDPPPRLHEELSRTWYGYRVEIKTTGEFTIGPG